MQPVDNYVSLSAAPLPTKGTLRRRQSLIYQLARFAALNLKMIRVIRRGEG